MESTPWKLVLAWLLTVCLQTGLLEGARELYQHGDCAGAVAACASALEHDPDDRGALELAGRVLRDPRHVADADSARCMAALAAHPACTRARVVPEGEPGQPLCVTGVVRDAHGKPLAARLHVFQTDKDGHYTPTKLMDEPHARLFGYLVTAADGRFELETIRPGGYPGTPERQGLEWRIPCHIHFEIESAGHATRRFQMVLDDDPRMEPEYWRNWARKGGHPVVKVTHDANGEDRAELEVALED